MVLKDLNIVDMIGLFLHNTSQRTQARDKASVSEGEMKKLIHDKYFVSF